MTPPRSVSAPSSPALLLGRLAGLAALGSAALFAPGARAASDYATPYTFTTLAGSTPAMVGANGTGAAAQFYGPFGVATDSSGNVYVADQLDQTIRKITPGGVVTTLAGTVGVKGSANGTGTAATFNNPAGVATDSSGNVYVADQANDTIREISPAGVVTTLAGTAGQIGSTDATGAAARFNGPAGVATDSSGNVYVIDQVNQTVRKIAAGGVVTTLAGTAGVAGSTDATGTTARFNYPGALCTDGSGNVYVADTNNHEIRMVTPAGVVTTLAGAPKDTGSTDGTGSAARFDYPQGIVADNQGNLFISDTDNNTIRQLVISSRAVTTIAGSAGIQGYSNGTGAGAEFVNPLGIAIDGGGNLYIADNGNDSIRKLAPGGTVTNLAGTSGNGFADGSGTAARFFVPSGVAVDASGNVYVADELNDTIRKITPAGAVTTIAGSPGDAAAADGTGSAARFFQPFGIAVDSSDNLYVSDAGNSTIRKIAPGGVVTTLAGTAGMAGYADGTGSAARFKIPLGVAVDGNGNVYVAEQGNFTIRKITPAGVVTTLAGTAGNVGSADGTGAAASFNLPAGVAVDSGGNVYVADYANDTIRKITPAGAVTTLAGVPSSPGSNDGTGSGASFSVPTGVAVDAAGNVYVTEQKGDTIRKVTSAGVVTTLAGTPTIYGDTNGTGATALFDAPDGIAVDASGNLYVADTGNNLIRKGNLTGAPSIQTEPSSQYAAPGASVTFSVTASGGSALSYQWNFNNAPITGANGTAYTVASAEPANAGTYTVTITDSGGTLTSTGATLTITTAGSGARLINISTRAQVGTGSSILIPGFYVGGSGMETLLIRADGPALTQFGVTGVLAAPVLSVYNSGNTLVASNTGWGTNTTTSPAQIASVSTQVGAFALSANSADSAVLVTLPPGAYTVEIAGANGTSGIALAEVYEVASTGTRLTNISTRANVTATDLIIPGFVIRGSGTDNLLIRADGPSLAQFGLTGVLAAPVLTVYDQTNAVIATNTGWGTATNPAQIASAAASVGAFAFTAGSADSAQLVSLAPGAYTVQVSGASSSSGVALAEVYETP